MATLVLSTAGAAVGGLIGGPIGSAIGRAAGGIAGSLIDNALFGTTKKRRSEGARLADLRVMESTEGTAIPRLWGRARLAGEMIWATDFVQEVTTRTESKSGGKGGGGTKTKTTVTEYKYYGNFAVALCEGAISGLGRCWADGKIFDLNAATHRLYRGTETQAADSLIVAKMGAGNAPAYRGTAYVVFEHLPLEKFGNRIPQLSFEVFRAVEGAGSRVRGVNIIPGATEFGYDTFAFTRDAGGGRTEAENLHASALASDWSVSMDQLAVSCPNLESGALVVSWFGDDLRCGSCLIRPAVERVEKATRPGSWKVAGLTRASAPLISQSGGAPAYGGTPTDASVLRAIADLKARGLRTVFYPFILMDIPPGGPQPAFPWRGRITCDPAPGEPGSPDTTPACAAQVAAFVGTAQPSHFAVSGGEVVYSGPAEWSLRRMVLHYAKLCQLAGGVDAFLIGSELRGMTWLRDGASSYPFVAALVSLAADVKAILPAAKISYAADWSEYFGHQPQDGSDDVFFHLDPLWASPDIDFVGIDNYMPLADWRDGGNHLDRLAGFSSIYDADYLKSNIAGGEGFDWYYASTVDRAGQVRTPIADWVFRFKDLKSWWLNSHVNRPGGVPSGAPTAWVPQSKPLWFTEAGCPAIDKGANQPNVFSDPKSSESAVPHFSSGARDDTMLARFVSTLMEYWLAAGAHNPVSALYGAPMVSAADIHIWAWDARPFPAFPARNDVWADGPNYERGHWLNGRLHGLALGEMVRAVCASYGFQAVATEGLFEQIEGLIADRIGSARDLIEPLAAAFAFDAVESGGLIRFRTRNSVALATIDVSGLAERPRGAQIYELARAQESDLPQAVRLGYFELNDDYRAAAVEARRLAGGSRRESFSDLPCVATQAQALARAEIMLHEAWIARARAEFALPPSRLALEPADAIALAIDGETHVLRIGGIVDGLGRRVKAHRHEAAVYASGPSPGRTLAAGTVPVIGPPALAMFDLALAGSGIEAHAPWIAAVASPWPGRLALIRKEGASFAADTSLDAPATMGELIDPLPSGPLGLYDRAARIRVKLWSGALQSVDGLALLGGANAAAIGQEIVQFRDAMLVAADTYEIGWLLRGQRGSEPEMLAVAAAGTRFVLLNGAIAQSVLPLSLARLESVWRIGPEGRDHGDPSYVEFARTPSAIGLRPLAPAQLRARRFGGDIALSWIRRTRIDGDSWELADVPLGEERESYAIDILDGAAVKRAVSVSAPAFTYALADQVADFGGPVSVLGVRIAQVSAVFGRGTPLERTIHA
jgi:GTA TIM-barrel-like domain/Putative phage tail protein